MSTNEIAAIIDKGCRFEGNLSFSGEVRISGTIVGSIFSNDTVVITETATINSDISANVILISGNVKGNLKATSRVEIKRPARFEGTITSPSLAVEEGVIFHGLTQMKDKK